jgi:Holliday junction DNA helicase RuvA
VIAKLRGRLDSLGEAHAVLDVGGVGYLVFASSRTLGALGPVGGDVTVHTEMLVAQDLIRLVGFGSAGGARLFRLLTGVQGVGSKVALAILSALPADELGRAIAAGDHRVWRRRRALAQACPADRQRAARQSWRCGLGQRTAAYPDFGGHAQDAVLRC